MATTTSVTRGITKCCTARITTQIILCIVVPIVMACIAVICTATISLNNSVPKWKADSNSFLTDSFKSRTITETDSIAQYIDITFKEAENSLNAMHNYVVTILNNNSTVTSYYNTYYGTFGIQPQLDNNGNSIASVAYYTTSPGNQITTNEQLVDIQYVNISSVFDNVFRSVCKSSTIMYNVFMGFNNGLYRAYPYASLSSYPTQTSICVTNNQPIIGYDPRCRPWYSLASQTDEIIYTSPYIETLSKQLIITTSKRVIVNNQIIGVLGVHFSMSPIDNNILKNTNTNYYRFLMDTTGNVISYPGLNHNLTPPNIASLEPTISSSQINQIISVRSTTPTFISINKNGNNWNAIVEYLKTGNYILVTLYSNTLIDEKITNIFSRTDYTVLKGTIAICIIIAIFLLFSISVIIRQSCLITRDIREFEHTLHRINENDLDIAMSKRAPLSAEFMLFKENIGNILMAVQFGNDAYLSGDHDRAIQLYEKLEKVLKENNNLRGLGICYSNKGNAYQRKNDMAEAEKWYIKSIEVLMEQMNKEILPQAITALKVTKSFRLMNLGVLYMNAMKYEKAFETLNKAMELARESDNVIGIIRIMGNIGHMYIKINDLNSARNNIYQAYEIVRNQPDQLTSIQYAMMNIGILEFHSRNYNEALMWFNNILKQPILDIIVKDKSIEMMYTIFMITNRIEDSSKLKPFLQNINQVYKQNDIKFILDISGSMSGQPIIECRKSIIDIIENKLNDSDNLSFFTFNNVISRLFVNLNRKTNFAEIIQLINNGTNPDGGTSFYRAIHDIINQNSDNDNSWLVALTDGEDNDKNYPIVDHNTINGLLDKKPINILIITVGLLPNRSQIQSIIKKVNLKGKKGMLIELDKNPQEIAGAFKKIAQIIAGELNVERL